MGRKKDWLLVGTGLLVGLMLGPTAAHAAEEWLKATPSTQIFIVNGQTVDLEAYAIHGNNFVMLRDIGKAVGFDVSYDAQFNAAVIDSTKPYFDDESASVAPSTPQTSAEPLTDASTDYTQGVNTAVFTPTLSREVYNAVKASMEHEASILAGTGGRVRLPEGIDTEQVNNLLAKVSIQPIYELGKDSTGTYFCDIHTSDANERAKQSVAPFLDRIEGMTDREKVVEMAHYVADHITYAIKYPYPDQVFGQEGQVEGCCMAYAYSFKTLCDLADIPCIFVSSPTHQWNQVYVDGHWWVVDVTGDDAGDETDRECWTILHDQAEMQGWDYVDSIPEITMFAKELLVPGSTK